MKLHGQEALAAYLRASTTHDPCDCPDECERLKEVDLRLTFEVEDEVLEAEYLEEV